MGQVEEGAQPPQFGVAERLALGPTLGAAEHGAQGDGKDIEQLVALGAVDARVGQRGEVLVNGRHGGVGTATSWG